MWRGVQTSVHRLCTRGCADKGTAAHSHGTSGHYSWHDWFDSGYMNVGDDLWLFAYFPFCGGHANFGDSLTGSHYVTNEFCWQCDLVSCCLYERVPLPFWCWCHTACRPPDTDCACSTIQFADADQYCHSGWSIAVTFFRTGNKHVPLAPNCRVLKNPVWCGFTWTKFIVGLKMAWDQELSSGLMLLTFITENLFQFRFAVAEQSDEDLGSEVGSWFDVAHVGVRTTLPSPLCPSGLPIMFPNKHRRGGRGVAHLCWFEANVKQEALFGTDKRSTELGHLWFHLAHVHDHSPFQLHFFVVVSLFLRALALNRIMFPGTHRAVERSVAHLCWFEANVGQEVFFGTDERPTEFGHHWFHAARARGHSPHPLTLRRY